MPRARTFFAYGCAVALAAFAVGCGGTESNSDSAASVDLADCSSKDQLQTVKPGVLTVGTDSPAYEPYFVDDDPSNGKGFESAVAYAIADQLGYAKNEVEWKVVPFNSSYAPGPKDFDFDLNQISITPEREKAVDFSSPYYTANQAVIATNGSEASKATSLDDLKSATIGVQIGTTSLTAVQDKIDPDSEVKVFDTSNDVVSALKNGQIDAMVTDLPTAIYLTAVELPDQKVVGQFAAEGGDEWGALLQKDSPATDCVSAAIDTLRGTSEETGELQTITDEWMSGYANAPNLD
jgi:polar amino acid transport system substrate-binding protein